MIWDYVSNSVLIMRIIIQLQVDWIYVSILCEIYLCRYIGRKAAEVDARMCNIKMPSKIMRSPRSITERSFWKGLLKYSTTYVRISTVLPLASEWKSFLLYYIPAALHGILPMKYFLHVFLLIKALRILLNESIERNELKLADRLFSKFCKLMETYYG